MRILDEDFALANGVRAPKIGLGTWQIPEGAAAYDAVLFALRHGYRHVDTARAYGNEASVGRAVRDCGIARDRVFVTSKLPAEIKSHDGALASFDQTMAALGLESLDLYLVHAPWPWHEKGADYRPQNRDVWRAMEKIYRSGRCRAVGVSNFNVSDLMNVLEICEVAPMVNQIRMFVGHPQEEVVAFCRRENILVEAYSPFATGGLLGDERIAAVARKYGATVPRICVRYLLQKETLPLPKSTHPEFIAENADVDFAIDAEDMKRLDGPTSTGRAGGGA